MCDDCIRSGVPIPAIGDVMAGRGLWLSADEARIVMRAIQRPRPVMVTEPGADVIARFMRRVEELERSDITALPSEEER